MTFPNDWADFLHRMLWTFVQTFAGTMLAATVLELEWSILAAAIAAGAADVLVLLKEYARAQLPS
jgi:ABC-type phosphate/phosphonate transport system permease subunit